MSTFPDKAEYKLIGAPAHTEIIPPVPADEGPNTSIVATVVSSIQPGKSTTYKTSYDPAGSELTLSSEPLRSVGFISNSHVPSVLDKVLLFLFYLAFNKIHE